MREVQNYYQKIKNSCLKRRGYTNMGFGTVGFVTLFNKKILHLALDKSFGIFLKNLI